MPCPAMPYLCRGWYVSNLCGKRHRLCPEADGFKAPRDALLRLQQEVEGYGGRTFPGLPVVELVALFLDSVKVERPHHAYLDYQRWPTEFARVHGHRQARGIPLQDDRPFRHGTDAEAPVGPAGACDDGVASEGPTGSERDSGSPISHQ